MGFFGTIVWIVALVCAVWVIYDVFTHQKKMKQEYKLLWTIAAVVFSIVTAIVYYFVYKHK
ncbi:MAG: PLDc N-terminal domain-containing protein [Candidatus Woesearchaeota archaeon]